MLLDAAGLGRYIDDRFHQSGDVLFRMELLPEYAVDSDGDDYQRWLDGETEPSRERKSRTLDRLRREREHGLISRRVRILSAHLTDYERYACDFGYRYNVPAGDDVRVLRRGEHQVPTLLGFDYWLMNDLAAARMHYDEHGRFRGAEPADQRLVEKLVQERDKSWRFAEPFTAWWSRHPELHRRLAA